jgi:hypothetical protein
MEEDAALECKELCLELCNLGVLLAHLSLCLLLLVHQHLEMVTNALELLSIWMIQIPSCQRCAAHWAFLLLKEEEAITTHPMLTRSLLHLCSLFPADTALPHHFGLRLMLNWHRCKS